MRLHLSQKLRRAAAFAHATLLDPRREGVPIAFVEPCYHIVDRLGRDSVVVDVGLGFDADFSQALIRRYGLTSLGFDPTRKHQSGLKSVEARLAGRFKVHEIALGPRPGTATFYESEQNVSGSLDDRHPNVRRDTVSAYEVQVRTLREVLDLAPTALVDLVKLDVEGAEFAVLEKATIGDLQRARQWVIEFHHDLLPDAPFGRTRDAIRHFRSAGFRPFTRDNVNFLFFLDR